MYTLNDWKISRLLKKIKSMKSNRINNQPNDELLKKEILCYFELAGIYEKLQFSKKYPYANVKLLECYRAAAGLDDSSAHFQLGRTFLEEAKFRQQLNKDGIFNSEANLRDAQLLFEEALAHLSTSEKLGNSGAKRLKGLCFINAWGVVEDKNAGFELVVASIDQEGSWDRIPQIFAEIGLNKPEFFAAIMQRRKG